MSTNSKPRFLGFRLNPGDPYKITPVEVTEEVYFALGRPLWRHQKRMYSLGKCGLPSLKWLWKCDGDCELCEFRLNGRGLPLDRGRMNTSGDTYRECDLMPSPDPGPESIAVDRITLHKLLARLDELFPEAVSAGNAMVEQGISQRQALDQMGLNRTTFRSQFEKASSQLCQEFGVDSVDELL